ncbi:MAG: ATPase domain-containing protein [Methanobacteriota archaeon]
MVPKAGKDEEATCPVCGGPIDEAGAKCARCGAAYVAPGDRKAKKKVQIAHGSKPEKKEAAPEKPPQAANDSKNAAAKESNADLAKWLSGEEEEKGLTDWLGGGKTEAKQPSRPSAKPAPAQDAKDSNVDALKAWLSGEEDTLTSWLGEDPTAKPKAASVPSVVSDEVSKELGERESALAEKETALKKREEDLDAMRGALQEQLSKVQTGEFDPMVLIEETARLNRDLQAEVRKRKELDDEIVQVKKGSIAVIKYVKAQQMQRGGDAARSIHKRLDEVTAEKERLTVELKKTMEINEKMKADMAEGLKALPDGDRAIKEKEMALMEQEKQLEASKAELHEKEKQMREAVISSGGGVGAASAELQQRLMAELGEKEKEWLKNEGELKKRILDLEANIQELKINQKQVQEAAELKGKGAEVNAELERKIRELQIKEKAMLLREEEIRRLSQQLKDKDEELKKVKEPLKYKEEELLRREEDLLHREKILMEERRKYEEAVKDTGSLQTHDMKMKIEELNQEINRKEEQIRTKEQYLNAKMEDLKLREQGLIGQEIEAREEDRKLELKIEKVKTGTSRLDDLLLGGIPFGTNVLVYGPPFAGKEIAINAFIADGLKKGVPAIWVITDKLPSEIREEMMFIVSGYEEYEKLGLVKYVDAYSKSIGEVTPDPNVTYIEEATDHVGILKAVDAVAKELLQKHKYYRVGFRSISTLIAYLDSNAAFKFLQPFVGRRKRERAVSLFSIEKGMHSDQDIQMIGSQMDGAIEFKIEQLKTFLCIKGIGDVQSKAWIEYTYSKQGMAVGSFSLDHIR